MKSIKSKPSELMQKLFEIEVKCPCCAKKMNVVAIREVIWNELIEEARKAKGPSFVDRILDEE